MKFDNFVNETINKLQGIAKGKSIEDIANKWDTTVEEIEKQIKIGAKIEHEHTKDNEVACTIAKDHIFEMGPKYYTKLISLEKQLKKENNMAGPGGVFGGTTAHGGDVGTTDWYAPGDIRIPTGPKKGKKKNKKFPIQRRTFPNL